MYIYIYIYIDRYIDIYVFIYVDRSSIFCDTCLLNSVKQNKEIVLKNHVL